MGCCGSSSDYNRPQQQMYQRPQPRPPRQQVYQPHQPQQHRPRPRQQQTDNDRRRAQAHATQAAQNFGWAGQQQQRRGGPPYYHPQQQQQQQQQHPQQQKQPAYSRPQHQKQMLLQQARPSKVVAFPAPPKPAYQAAVSQRSSPTPARYRPSPQRPPMAMPVPVRAVAPAPAPAPAPKSVIRQQPTRMQPMSAAAAVAMTPGHLRDASGAAHRVQVQPRHPMAAVTGRRPMVGNAAAFYAAPQPQPQPQAAVFGNVADFEPRRIVRRDSNGVSEFGDDDDDDDDGADDPASWRGHTVSPSPVSPRAKMGGGASLYGPMGMNYARVGGF